MSKYIELAKKLKALADRGEGGEKINAEQKLNEFCKKHKIPIESLETEETEAYFIDIEEDEYAFNGTLLNQIAGLIGIVIKGPLSAKDKIVMDTKCNLCFISTASEYAELMMKYDFYKSALKKEAKVFMYAFCNANDLLIQPKEGEQPSEIHRETAKKATLMSMAIDKSNFYKQIEEK